MTPSVQGEWAGPIEARQPAHQRATPGDPETGLQVAPEASVAGAVARLSRVVQASLERLARAEAQEQDRRDRP